MDRRRSKPSCTLHALAVAVVVVLVASACSGDDSASDATTTTTEAAPAPAQQTTTTPPPTTTTTALPNVYTATLAGNLSPAVAGVPPRVYVPNNMSNTVTVIDATNGKVIETFPVGASPQHVVPSWDLKTLYVNNTEGNTLTPIDPRTGKPGAPIPVEDPYNLYFSVDGQTAIVMAERLNRIDLRDPVTWQLRSSIRIPYSGVNHADFSPDGRTMWASCEFSGWVVQIDLVAGAIANAVNLGGSPIDVRLAPDGKAIFVANQGRGFGGVHVLDPVTLKEITWIPTGAGAHGVYPSRDTKKVYVSNRDAGSVSVIDVASLKVDVTWATGGSPDMGGVSADGNQLWLSNRFGSDVSVIDTNSGNVISRIPTGQAPHGLALFPQPGRYSLGHTGNYR